MHYAAAQIQYISSCRGSAFWLGFAPGGIASVISLEYALNNATFCHFVWVYQACSCGRARSVRVPLLR
eukprot:1966043-Lingulodinium_polyedra.AAC.1